jgi:hypothetical protein
VVTYHSLLFLCAGFGASLKVHRAQPGAQAGRRKSAAPLSFNVVHLWWEKYGCAKNVDEL